MAFSNSNPAIIDLPAGNNLWTEQDLNNYWKLPYFLAKQTVKSMPLYTRWTKLLGKQNWTPNQSTIMRGVRKVMTPVLRQELFPSVLQTSAKRDKIIPSEVSEQAQLYHHKLESYLLTFHPDFQDFLDNAEAINEDMTQKMVMIPEQFYRAAIFHGSPKAMVCGGAGNSMLMNVAHYTGSTIIAQKNQAELQNIISRVTQPLSLVNLHLATQYLLNDMGAVPYSGGVLADGTDGSFLTHKFVLIGDNELWQNWVHDPYLQANRQLNLDIVTSGFRGSLFGCVTSMIERYPYRIAADGTIPGPETMENNSNAFNYGDVFPAPAYVSSPIGVAFLVGYNCGYKVIKPGPPPAPFSRGGLDASEFQALDWNGKIRFTKNVMVQVLDENGNVALDTNKYGEYGQFISQMTMGIIPEKRFHVLPIFYIRTRPGGIR